MFPSLHLPQRWLASLFILAIVVEVGASRGTSSVLPLTSLPLCTASRPSRAWSAFASLGGAALQDSGGKIGLAVPAAARFWAAS